MNQDEIIKRLKEPFTNKEIEWKIQATTQDKIRGMAVAYIDSRAIQKRLDEVVGAFNWRNEYVMWQEKSQICGLSIFCEERKEWITKFDGAENTDYEPIKGGLSDAFKRAAILWGIGRYLYELNGIWVDIEQRGKSLIIKDNQYDKLEFEYNKAIAKVFNTAAGGNDNTTSPNKKEAQKLHISKSVHEESKPKIAEYNYKVRSVKPSGKTSQLLELVNSNGEIINAYIKNGDNAIAAGACLSKVNIVQKTSSYGPYNLINAYELAA